MGRHSRETAAELFSIAKWICACTVAVWGYGWVFYHVLDAVRAVTDGSPSAMTLASIALIGLTGLVFRYLQRRFEQ